MTRRSEDVRRAGDVVSVGLKVVLRRKRAEDAANDYRWRTDPELAELDATVVMRMSFEEYQHRYEEELRYPTPWVKRFAVETLDGLHIGNCMAYDIDTASGEGEVGIMLGERDYWGKGFGRDAIDLLLNECFAMPSIHRLYLHTLEWNTRARKAFARAGFREVRPVRRGGKNFVLMEIRRGEWDAGRASADADASGPAAPS